MVVAVAFSLLLFGVIWWIVVGSYALYVRQAPHPLPWYVYLPTIAFMFVPVVLTLAVMWLLTAGPVLVIPKQYRTGPVGIGVWLLYPALLGCAGLGFTDLDVAEVVFISAGVLFFSSRAIWEPSRGSRLFEDHAIDP
jgi:hypothetical protein